MIYLSAGKAAIAAYRTVATAQNCRKNTAKIGIGDKKGDILLSDNVRREISPVAFEWFPPSFS